MPEPSFLRELHSRFGLPGDLVVQLIERATGRDVDHIQRIVDDNEEYDRAECIGALFRFAPPTTPSKEPAHAA